MDDFGEPAQFLTELAEEIEVAEEIKTGDKTKVKVKPKYLNIIGELHIYLSPGGFDKNAFANFVRTDP